MLNLFLLSLYLSIFFTSILCIFPTIIVFSATQSIPEAPEKEELKLEKTKDREGVSGFEQIGKNENNFHSDTARA
jgi:hypothetical protein